jgi:Leucine-rich repeat (LRR) protein
MKELQAWLKSLGLDYTIAELNKLKFLFFNYFIPHTMTTIPDSIGELKELMGLALAHNDLQSIPNSIGELKNLRTLNLVSNNLHTLPDSIGKLKNLDGLFFDDNPNLIIFEDQVAWIEKIQSHTDLTKFRIVRRNFPEVITERLSDKSLKHKPLLDSVIEVRANKVSINIDDQTVRKLENKVKD